MFRIGGTDRDVNKGFVGSWGRKIERVWNYRMVMVTQHFEGPECSQIAKILNNLFIKT